MSEHDDRLDRIEKQLDRAERANGLRNRSEMNFNVNGGGWVTGMAAAVSVMCLAVVLALAFQQQKTDTRQDADIRELRAEQRRADDYRSLLYRNYPELRPEILKKHEAENH